MTGRERETMSARDLVGQTVAGLRLEEIVGSGSMGVVYRATDLATGRQVAAKRLSAGVQLDPEARARIEREFRVTCGLSHPNLVSNLRLDMSRPPYILVQEFVAGTDAARLLDDGPLPPPRAVLIAIQAGRGLDYLHERGLIHRDIKPSNLLVTPDGLVKVADLGLVKSFVLGEGTEVTEAGAFMGTPAYLPPEVVTDEFVPNPRSDMYSLGATLYHLLAGRPPFEGRTPVSVFRQIGSESPVPLAELVPGLPSRLVSIALRLMARDPGRRYARAAELVRDLETVM